MAEIIDGKLVAQETRDKAALVVARVREAGVEPGLAVVLVGDDPASQAYVRMKERDCAEVGIKSFDYRRPAGITQEELHSIIDECNANPDIHGILVQMPLPRHLDAEAAVLRIDPHKDVDGFHPVSLGSLVRGVPAPRACTPWGVMAMLDRYGIDPSGKSAVVIGRSTIVGKPMALMLLERNATVTVCHSKTQDLPGVCRQADILVAAVGRPKMVTAEYVKPGAVVVDVGINSTDEGMVGDVDFDAVSQVASWITPVPGGVGPMTRAMLVLNTAEAAARSVGLEASMRRLATLFVAACVLLAVGGVAYAAPADDVAPMDVQVWPGAEPGQLLVIVSTFLPESTKLPATVRIPVVDGMQLLWSGEIGGDAGGDIKIEPKIKKGVGGDYAEFEVTQFRQAQIELGSVALSQTAEGFSAKVDFVQTVPVDTTSFSARLPAGATNVKLDPAPASGPDRNQAGESLYTLPSKQLKAGEQQTVSVSYAIGVGQAVDGGGSRNNVLGILVGLVAVAIVVLIVVVVRQRGRGASEHEDIEVADE